MENVHIIAAAGSIAALASLACLALWMAYRRAEEYASLYRQCRKHGSTTYHNLQVLREATKAHLDKPTTETQFRLRAVLKDL